jgi:hypothetical protein
MEPQKPRKGKAHYTYILHYGFLAFRTCYSGFLLPASGLEECVYAKGFRAR